MLHQVKTKQPNSKMCLVCGLKNKFGLQASFYELDNNELLAIFKPRKEHQGYPGRLHGGIISAILDEAMGRAIMIQYDAEIWGVTMELNVRFRHPVPLDEEVRLICRVTKETRLHFEGSGEILLQDGRVAIKGQGKYLKLPIEKIADFDIAEQEWRIVHTEHDPEFIEIESG